MKMTKKLTAVLMSVFMLISLISGNVLTAFAEEPPVSVTKIDVPSDGFDIVRERTVPVRATIKPENATNPALKWVIADPTVAAFMLDGNEVSTFETDVIGPVVPIKGIKKGKTTVTVTALDGSGTEATFDVDVLPKECAVIFRATPVGGGTAGPEGAHKEGDIVTVRAAANDGYSFVKWTEDGIDVSTDAIYTFTVEKDRVLTAVFEANSYKVTWDNGDGRSYEQSVKYGDIITIPTSEIFNETVRKTGHTLASWQGYTEGMTMPAEDVTFTASYEVNSYKVTWDNGDGRSYEQSVKYGDIITIPTSEIFNETVRKTGHTLASWQGYTEGMTMPAEDVTFTASYEANEYTVSFNAGGGEAIEAITVTYDEAYGPLPEVSDVTGLTCDGKWYLTDADGNVTDEIITAETIVKTARNHTLSVKRDVAEPILSINLTAPGCISDNYGYYNPENSTRIITVTVGNKNDDVLTYSYEWYKEGELVSDSDTYDDVLTLAGNVSDSGTYKVVVKAELDGGAGIASEEAAASAEAEKVVTIRRISNTLSYDAVGGENAPGSHYTNGERITVASGIPVKEGYRFEGWNTKADGSGISYPGESEYIFEGDNGNGGLKVTLYAIWVEKEVITVDEALQEFTYDGEAKAFEIKGDVTEGFTVRYKKGEDEVTPIDAGTYDVVITREEDDSYKKFEKTVTGGLVINKATHAITEADLPEAGRITKGKTLSEVKLTPYELKDEEENVIGTFEWAEPDEVLSESGTFTKEIKFTPADSNNYNGQTFEITFRVFVNLGSVGGDDTRYFNIQFESNGGSYVSIQNVEEGMKVKEPKAPTKEGYEFAGWFADKKLTKEYNFSKKVTEGFTLYAAWEEEGNEDNQIILTIDKKKAIVFGETVTNDVAPIIVSDRTMLPIRFIAEALGAEVTWDEDKREVTISRDDTEIVITIDSDEAKVGWEKVKLDSPAFIENDRTYLPLRFVAENLGAKVEWIEDERQVIITK